MQNNLEDNDKILELEEKIENLNSNLNEKKFIINQTKEYLFLLESEYEKNVLKLNKIKMESSEELDKIKRESSEELDKIKRESSEELNKINKINKDYENRIKMLENKNARLKHDNENLEKQIKIMKSTVSWKITKPLRRLRNLFR